MDIDIEGCSAFWQSLKKDVVVDTPNMKCCNDWGRHILRTWKNAPKLDKENQGTAKRAEIETEIIEPLFHCAIFTKKPYSQRFQWIIEAFLEEENPSKKLRAMFFRCTLPVVWRNLEVPNNQVRTAASWIVLNFFPLLSDDEFVKEEYLKRQQEAMDRMLMDDCVPIRVFALKVVPRHLCAHWEIFPRELIKAYLSKIVDCLSLDALPEVRAAFYEGIGHLLPRADALTATQRSLEILAKRGTNDKTEKVRLSAFRMLNKLHGHRYIKLLDLIPMNNLLLRLDFEHSKSVQREIVQLLFRPFIPKHVDGIDYMERFKRVFLMCKTSRNASFHLHHLIYPQKLIGIEVAVHHIRSLLLGVKAILKKSAGIENGGNDTTDVLNMSNISGISSMMEEVQQKNGGSGDIDEQTKLRVTKDVLDSSIVLWMAIRYDLFNSKNAKYNLEMIRMMSSILDTLNQFSDDSAIMDSALVIASQLPKDKVLRKLRNALVAITDPSALSATPLSSRRRLETNPYRESPPSKRVKVNENVVGEFLRPLELIQTLISSPLASEELKTNFTVHLDGFFECLSVIHKQFGKLLLLPGWEQKFSPQVLFSAYETFNILALITKRIEEPSRREEINEAELNLPTNDRLLYNELKWFADVVKETRPTFNVMKMFLRCVDLHIIAGQLSYLILNETANMFIKLKEILEDIYNAGPVEIALRKSVACLKEALLNCDDREQANKTIQNKIDPLLDYLEETTLVEEIDEQQQNERGERSDDE
uniref:Condensin-2 complex subunit G2 n=1 Tax=Meloidogyne incognita TaxID=6306 RepID=A0A914MXS5_MELIC